MHGYVRFKLPTFNALDEAIVHGSLDYAWRVELKMSLESLLNLLLDTHKSQFFNMCKTYPLTKMSLIFSPVKKASSANRTSSVFQMMILSSNFLGFRGFMSTGA